MNEKRLWQVVIISVVFVGVIVVFLNPLGPEGIINNGYRLLSIFLGMLAGIALGELFKIRSNEKIGQGLLEDLVEELRVNNKLLGADVKLRKGFWILGIRSGLVRYLQHKERRMLWNTYGLITHYQEAIEILHKSKLLGETAQLTPEFQNHITHLRQEIRKRIEVFLDKHPPNGNSVRTTYQYPPELSVYTTHSSENDV
jgi:hypothetical protein